MAAPVAAGTAVALADAMTAADLATRTDVAQAESRILTTIGMLTRSMEARIERLRRDMTIKLGKMIFVAVGVIIAAMRVMPPP